MCERVRVLEKKSEAAKENRKSKMRESSCSQSINSPVDRVLFLQRTIGNRAVEKLIRSGTLQAKLRIGQPGDAYEQEADRVADLVIRMPAPSQRKCTKCEEELRKWTLKTPQGSDNEVTPEIESDINSLISSGDPLPESSHSFFEPRFGYDFGQVRIHTGAKAVESTHAMNSPASMVEQDVVFGAGQYIPETADGSRLVAHKLTHFVISEAAIARQESSESEESLNFLKPMEASAEPEIERIAESSDLTSSYGSIVDAKVIGPYLCLRSPPLELNGVATLDNTLVQNRRFRVGFIQNVIFDWGANAEYVDNAGQPYKQKMQIYPWPVLDGDANSKPWYGPEAIGNVKDFTGTASMKDQPRNAFVLQVDRGKGILKETWGSTSFQTHFVAQDMQSNELYFLDWVRWEINWASDIYYNAQDAGSSVVNSEGEATKRQGKGIGGQKPVIAGKVANESSITKDTYY